jgi:tight adherence protein B
VTVDPALLLAIITLLLVTGSVVLLAPAESAQDRAAQRLASYAAPASVGVARAISIVRQRRYSRFAWLDALIQRIDPAATLTTELAHAGVPMRSGEFVALPVAAAAAAAACASLAPISAPIRPLVYVGAAAAGFLAPRLWLCLKRARRVTAFERDLADAIDLAAGSLRAGYGIAHGLDLVAREMSGPCAEEFGQVLQDLSLGAEFDVALAHMVERVPCDDVRLLATAVGIQRRSGGNLVEVLGAMSSMIRERFRLRGEVRAITTGPRISGYLVAMLPIGTAVMMFISSRYYINILLTDPRGQLALGVSACFTLAGLYLNHRIAQVEL